MSTFKDKFKKTSEILGASAKKYAEKASDYAKEKYEKLDNAYTEVKEIEQKIEEQFSDIHSEDYEETAMDGFQKNQEIQELLRTEMAEKEHTISEKAFLWLKLLGRKLQDLEYKNQMAQEKYEKYGIEDWNEERILYELRKTNDFFEKRVLTQKLEEVRSNDEED